MRLRLLFVSLLVSAALLSNAAVAGNIAHGVSVVVIDPGHGGRLPGAHYGSVYEKDLVLKVGLRLGKLIEEGMPGVKVVYTRTTDKMLGATLAEDLQKRADIANEAGGDLFISIHANAAAATAAKGVEVLVMGETPKEQRYNTEALYESNREDLIDLATEPNAAIVRARIQNLQITYGEYSMAIARCIERSFREAGRVVRRIKPQLLRVLYATDMPGVLTEIGFMSNAQEMAYMKSERGLDEIARNLYDAVRNYSDFVLTTRRGDGEAAVAAAAPSGGTAETPSAQPSASGDDRAAQADKQEPVRYTVQVLASAKPVSLRSSEFKSYRGKVRQLKASGALPYKYCVGEYDTEAAAQRHLRQVRKVFPDAFVVRCRGAEIVK